MLANYTECCERRQGARLPGEHLAVLIYLYLMFFLYECFLDIVDGCVCVCSVYRRVPKLPWRWKTAKWLTAQHRQNTWGQRWDTQTTHSVSLSLSLYLSLSLCLSLSLFLSDTNNSLCISSTENVRYVRMPASPGLRITKRSSFLTKVLITSPFFSILLLCCLICVNAFYAEPKPPSLQPFLFFPTYLRASFSRWAKALIHLPLSKDAVLQWHSYYSPLPAPPPIPTMRRERVLCCILPAFLPACLPA